MAGHDRSELLSHDELSPPSYRNFIAIKIIIVGGLGNTIVHLNFYFYDTLIFTVTGDLCDAGWEGAEPGQDFDQLSEEDLR